MPRVNLGPTGKPSRTSYYNRASAAGIQQGAILRSVY